MLAERTDVVNRRGDWTAGVGLAGLGWIARREPRLRTAATAWTATAGCLFALFLALEVVAALK